MLVWLCFHAVCVVSSLRISFLVLTFLIKKVNIASMLIQLSVTCYFAHQRLKSGGADILCLILVSTALLSVREHLHYTWESIIKLILLLFLFMTDIKRNLEEPTLQKTSTWKITVTVNVSMYRFCSGTPSISLYISKIYLACGPVFQYARTGKKLCPYYW